MIITISIVIFTFTDFLVPLLFVLFFSLHVLISYYLQWFAITVSWHYDIITITASIIIFIIFLIFSFFRFFCFL